MRSLLLSLLLGGVAWGQTSKPPVLVCGGTPVTFMRCDYPPVTGEMRYEPYIWYGSEWHSLSKLRSESAQEVSGLDRVVPITGPAMHVESGGEGICCDKDGGEYPKRLGPEPFDVPAIEVMVTSWTGIIPHPTCADKSRILLTAEDGTRHCIKFPEAQ